MISFFHKRQTRFCEFALFVLMIYVKNLESIQIARLARNHKFDSGSKSSFFLL